MEETMTMRTIRNRGRLRATLLVMALALNLPEPAHAAGTFEDPLDTPAQASRLASRGLFNGLAQADSRLVAVGQRGHVLFSDDGGQNWTQADVPVSSDLTAVSFPTARDGWAVGHDGVILVSHDAGATWVKQLDGRQLGTLLLSAYPAALSPGPSPAGGSGEQMHADAQRFADEGPDKPFLDVHFEDAQRGFVVGPFNLVLGTEDGGATWSPWMHRTQNPKALHLYALRSVGDAIYAAGEQGLLMRLDRSAREFQAIAVPYQGTLFGITGDADSLLVYGLRGNALRSGDGGRSWTPIATHVQVTFTSSARNEHGDLLLATQTGQVLASTDGGATFAALTLPSRVPASAVLATSDALIVAGPRGLQRIALPSRQN
jgi:photosystem II stability/assembly factor-like uncharacterized protein